MIEALHLSIRQLGDKAILRVFLKSLGTTVLIFAMLGVALWYGAQWLALWAGMREDEATIAALVAVLAGLLAAWLLFRAVAIAVIGIFADEVVMAVERKHYPDALAHAHDVALPIALWMGLRSALRAVGVNLLASPLYLLLLVTGVGTAIAFFLVNAWLLGRDLGDMVAVRHMRRAELPAWRGRTRVRRFLLGSVTTGLLLIPFVNLAAPVLGAAMATHLFHRRQK